MEFGKTTVGSCIFKGDIVGVILSDVVDYCVELLEVLASLDRSALVEKIDPVELISGDDGHDLEKVSINRELIELGLLEVLVPNL